MAIVLGIALALILAGLVMAVLSKQVAGLLGIIVYWVGIVLIIIGLIFLLSPVILWLNAQLRAMLNV